MPVTAKPGDEHGDDDTMQEIRVREDWKKTPFVAAMLDYKIPASGAARFLPKWDFPRIDCLLRAL